MEILSHMLDAMQSFRELGADMRVLNERESLETMAPVARIGHKEE